MRWLGMVVVGACAAVGAARAAGVGDTYPPGSITNREQAQKALDAARAADQEAETAYRNEMQRCATVFLQNQCTEDARRALGAKKHELRRVEIEAREVKRRLDAEDRAKKRMESEAKRQSEPAPKPVPEAGAPEAKRQPGAAPKAVPDDAARAAEQAERDKAAAANRESYQQKQKAHAEVEAKRQANEAAQAEQRAENVKELEEKQRDAAEYAKKKRREDRRIERERLQKEREEQAKKNSTQPTQ